MDTQREIAKILSKRQSALPPLGTKEYSSALRDIAIAINAKDKRKAVDHAIYRPGDYPPGAFEMQRMPYEMGSVDPEDAYTPVSGEAEMRSYTPSLRERVGNFFYDNKIGMDPAHTRRVVQGAADFVPGVGDAIGVDEAVGDYQLGNYGRAAAGGALAAAGMIPMAGDLAQFAGRKLMRQGGEAVGGAAARLGHNGGPSLDDPLEMYGAQPGSDPRYLGKAPDRSGKTYLRYAPKKGVSPRITASLEKLRDPANPVRQSMINDIRAGEKLGGNEWYNTEELRDWFVKEHGDDEGQRQWAEFMDLMGTTSPGSNVDVNLGNASAVRQRMYQDPDYVEGVKGVETLDDAKAFAKTRQKGYGHKTQNLQELGTARYMRGEWDGAPEPGVSPGKGNWLDQPKPKGFSNSLKGNERNIAADLHFTRYMAMASQHPDWLNTTTDVSADFRDRVLKDYPGAKSFFSTKMVNGKEVPTFNPSQAVKAGTVPLEAIAEYPSIWAAKPNDNEYGAFEEYIAEIGNELGMTPAQVQANLWMGAAKRTGVDDASQGTFMELLRKRADKRAAKDGMSREQVLRRFVREKGLLAIPGAVAAGILTQEEADQISGEY
jgi:hypothetical protein